MAKNKTNQTDSSVTDFLNALKSESKRKDSLRLIELIAKITKLQPNMWGTSIIGFGSYHYVSESGHEGDSPLVSFSPRAAALTLYLPAFDTRAEFLEKLGKHKISKGCVYIEQLDDVDVSVLEKLILNHIKEVSK